MGMVGEHPLQLSPVFNSLSQVLVPNSMSVVYFVLVANHPRVCGLHLVL